MARKLNKIEVSGPMAALVKALEDPDEQVVLAAVSGLVFPSARGRVEIAVRPLLEIIADNQRPLQVRSVAIQCLTYHPSAEIALDLLRLVSDPSQALGQGPEEDVSMVRVCLSNMVTQAADARALPLLESLAQQSESPFAVAAADLARKLRTASASRRWWKPPWSRGRP